MVQLFRGIAFLYAEQRKEIHKCQLNVVSL